MLSQEFIQSQIMGMGVNKFDHFVAFVFNKVFGYYACPVNGKGDGGNDFRLFEQRQGYLYQDNGHNKMLAIQVTTQDLNWDKKAFADAKKAKETMPDLSSFMFVTSRCRESAELIVLQNKITQELNLSATCLCARELANLVFTKKLFHEFSAVTGLEVSETIIGRPDSRLKMLHRLFALHEKRSIARDEVYDTMILSILTSTLTGIEGSELIKQVRTRLNLSETCDYDIKRRFDSLLSNKRIQKNGNNFVLTPETQKDLELANATFEDDIHCLESEIKDIIKEDGGNIDTLSKEDSIEEIAMLIAECYVDNQIRMLNRITTVKLLEVPTSDLDLNATLTKLLFGCGVKSVEKTRERILSLASSNMLIKKLVNATIYASIEHQSNPCSVIMLGEYDWQKVKVLLDASVAIPFLVTSLFSNTSGRFSEVYCTAIDCFKRKHAKILITNDYINECSSHLVEALSYAEIIDLFPEQLQKSSNRYVSHYCQMLVDNTPNRPKDFFEYIGSISSEALKQNLDTKDKIKRVMAQIRPLFLERGVYFESISDYDVEIYRKPLEVEYSYQLEATHKKRPEHLIRHDLNTLAHIQRQYSEHNEAIVFLTWDSIMLGFSHMLAKSGIIVSPAEAIDIFQFSGGISDEKMFDIAMTFATTNANPNFSAIAFLDHIIMRAKSFLPEFQLRNLSNELLNSLLESVERLSKNAHFSDNSGLFDAVLREKGVLPPIEESSSD